ncbi:hypothetical protein RJT34_11736 [Clitoria ternatea]|uniref:Uncharacterized protein n=1 Tax=Clitoria ternatea TaxID=43366 RepID=A0AAN9JKH3_CLITE
MEGVSSSKCHVVAMAYPARGHINPMMNMCKQIVANDKGIHVTFVVTKEWLGFIGADPKPDNIELRSIFPDVVPYEVERANDHLGFTEAVMTKMEAPFEELFQRLQHRQQ